jgi:hypothetical protein
MLLIKIISLIWREKTKKNLEKSWTNIAENEEAELRLLQDMNA